MHMNTYNYDFNSILTKIENSNADSLMGLQMYGSLSYCTHTVYPMDKEPSQPRKTPRWKLWF